MTYALTLPLGSSAPVEACQVRAYTIPTDRPEGDGTLTWDRTTLVVAHLDAGGEHGLGYTYGSRAVGAFIDDVLAPALRGRDALDVAGAWEAMRHALRNHGRPGIASMALAALDIALWDLKAKLLGLPLVRLLGRAREAVPAYGSGGFTTYSSDALRAQLGDWARDGFRFVKMKVGMRPDDDLARVCAARDAVGEAVELFVDANGAYGRAEALAFANAFADYGVAWFEEPVSSDDLDGLRLIAQRAPGGMAVAAGEYGYDAFYFERMLNAGAVHVLQADATRCGGITGFLQAASACEAHGVPLSAHTAPSLHAHLGCACARVAHVEYFHDHARIERTLFDGASAPTSGMLAPDLARPGLGLTLREADAAEFAI